MDLKLLSDYLLSDVISDDYASDILNQIDFNMFHYSERGVLRFGKEHYKLNIISDEIPSFLLDLGEFLRIPKFESVSINMYRIGDLIYKHKDIMLFNDVYILSLLSDSLMNFYDGRKKLSINLPKNSLFRMTGTARNKWMHSLGPVDKERISIVFR